MPSASPTSTTLYLETSPEGFRWRFGAMGTRWEVIVSGLDRAAATGLLQRSVQWIHGFEARYSRFRADSLVSRINARAGSGEWTALTPADESVFRFAEEAWYQTAGLVDPSTLPLALAWDYRREDPQPPTEEEKNRAQALTGWEQVERGPHGVRLPRAGMGLDFGGFGKELAVDQLAQMVLGFGATAGLVNGGGDVAAVGTPPDRPCWHVGLEDARTPTGAERGVGLRDLAVASSGHHRRAFTHGGRRYSHILDPRTGEPSTSPVLAASIVAPTCFQAGLLATCACLLEPAEALRRIEQVPLAEGTLQTPEGFRSTAGFSRFATLSPSPL